MEITRIWSKTAVFISIFGFGVDLIGVFDWLEVNFGAHVMIAEYAPLLSAFLPYVGLFIVLSLVFGTIERLKTRAINDFEEIQRCGEECVDWASADVISMINTPRGKTRLRYIILSKKYEKWLKEPRNGHSANNVVLDAASCAETIRAYGYVRGRFIIWKKRRRWNKKS